MSTEGRSASAWLGSQLAHAQGLDETIFYHVDHLGSTQLITDMAKVVVEEFRYDVFGKIRWGDEPSTSLGYTGHEPDNETGLVYFGARHLNPEDGAFMSVDPAGQYPSPYVHGGYDPMNGRDADGSLFQSDGSWLDAVVAVLDGYVSGVGSSASLEGGSVQTPESSSTDATEPTNGLTRDALEAFDEEKMRRWELMHKPCVGDAISEAEERAVGSQPDAESEDETRSELTSHNSQTGFAPDDQVKGLNPALREKLGGVLGGLRDLGYQPRVAEGLRTPEEQREKIARKVSPAGSDDPKSPNASPHLFGRSADVIDRRWGWNTPGGKQHLFWDHLHYLAEAEGLVWGGHFKRGVAERDVAHVELP